MAIATAAKKSKTAKKVKKDYKIDSKLIDELYKVRLKLHSTVSYGSRIAGLCLLGEKDGLIDHFVPMISKYGCFDSPRISHAAFDRAFIKMTKKDRAVMGMALIRPGTYGASLPRDFQRNISDWEKSFLDIEKTIWIVVSAKEIIPYSVSYAAGDLLAFKECKEKIFTNPGDSKMLKIYEIRQKMRNLAANDTKTMRQHLDKLAKTIENDTSGDQIVRNIEKEKKLIDVKRRERLDKLKEQREARKKKEAIAIKLFDEQKQKKQKRQKQEKDGMKDSTDIGGGYFLIKGKNGKDVLWKK